MIRLPSQAPDGFSALAGKVFSEAESGKTKTRKSSLDELCEDESSGKARARGGRAVRPEYARKLARVMKQRVRVYRSLKEMDKDLE